MVTSSFFKNDTWFFYATSHKRRVEEYQKSMKKQKMTDLYHRCKVEDIAEEKQNSEEKVIKVKLD